MESTNVSNDRKLVLTITNQVKNGAEYFGN
jgi:hypothetical protein